MLPVTTGDDALEADETRRRKRRGEGKVPVPTPYALPESVTITPEPTRDPALEELYQSKFTDKDKAIEYDDDGFMSPIEGESKQQIEQRKAHNCRIQKGSVRATLRSGPEGPILARENQREYSKVPFARPRTMYQKGCDYLQ
jgi:hypothetical protein